MAIAGRHTRSMDGKVALLHLRPFMKPSFYHRKWAHKSLTKAVPCFYTGPGPNRLHDAMCFLTKDSRELVMTRDFTWLDVSAKVAPALEKPISPAARTAARHFATFWKRPEDE